MASVIGTYARAFAEVVMGNVGKSGKGPLDAVRALQELHDIKALLQESDQLRRVLENPSIPETANAPYWMPSPAGSERPGKSGISWRF